MGKNVYPVEYYGYLEIAILCHASNCDMILNLCLITYSFAIIEWNKRISLVVDKE